MVNLATQIKYSKQIKVKNMKLFYTKIIIAILIIILPAYLHAQDFTVSLNSRKFIPEENISSISKKSSVFTKTKFDDKNYVVLQFKTLPTQIEKEKLESEGIKLIDYLPNNAYTSTMQASTDLGLLKSFSLRSVFYLKAADKAMPSVLAGKAMPHAIKQVGFVDLTILTYDLLSKKKINEPLAKIGATIISEQPMFKNFIIRIPKNNVRKLADLSFVQWVEFIDPPNKPENLLGRSLHRVNILQDGVRNLKGDGMNIGIFDEIASQHIDFSPAGRLINVDAGGAGSHGTHVSGTVGGKGIIDPIAKGMAPNATIYSYSASGDVQVKMSTEIPLKTLISSNHSYHDGLGVQCGVTGASAGYSLRARNTDINLNNSLYHLHCHSSGNNQAGCASGWGTITGTGKAAKNNIVVGNITSAELLSTSSSCGPVHDGRVKPEIVAMGTNVFSTYTPLNTYGTISGTSMSTPGITGTVALLAQHYKQLNANVLPPSALIKNVICNTATDLGNLGPDYRFGYGRINALKSAKIIEQNRYALDNVSTGNTKDITITVPSGASKINVMLTWNDPAATSNAALALVNNLDLQVITGVATTLPWILDPLNPASAATKAVNTVSNIEQVTINNPVAATYTLRVLGTSVPIGANQAYAITWDVEVPYIEVLYPNGNEKLKPGFLETITWDNAGITANQLVEYSLDGSSAWTTIGTVSAATTRLSWTVPTANTSTAKIRITSGTLTDNSDNGFNIMSSVIGFTGSGVSCTAGQVIFNWSPVTNATSYDLLVLNTTTGNFDVLAANLSGTNYTANGLTAGASRWFSIVAKNSINNALSERANAINIIVSSGGGGMGALSAIGGQNAICGTQSALSYSIAPVSGATSYTWSVPAGATITSGQGSNNVFINYAPGASSGNVSVFASNATCNTEPINLPITIGAPAANAISGGNQTQNICFGTSIPTLTATAAVPIGNTLKWYNAASGGSVVINPILNAVGNVTYYASATNNTSLCESEIRTPVSLTINNIPIATISAISPTTFCQGGSVVLTANNGSSYSWSNGATTQSITANTTGSYTCTVTTATCTNTSAAINVVVNPKPIATLNAGGVTTFCQPNTVTLTASNASSWLWSNGATTQSILVSNSGNYSVTTANNGCISDVSASISVTANIQPIVNITASPYSNLQPGLTTTLTAEVTPASSYTYVWTKDGAIIPAANSATINVTYDKLGKYTATATNSTNCSKSSSIINISDSASTKLFILPNPNRGQFDVIYHSTSTNEQTLKIFDAKGALVFTKSYPITLPYQRLSVDMRMQGKGTYFVGLFSNGVKIASGKVLIQ